VTAIVFSLLYVVTQHRVMVRLVAGEPTLLVPGTFAEMVGVPQFRQRLPVSIALERLEPDFWGNDRLASLSAQLLFTDHPGDQPRRVEVALSDKSHFGPFLVYQISEFGVAFDLQFLVPEREGLTQERLILPYPGSRDKAAYGEILLKESGLLLKGKFFADSGKKSMKLGTPLLVLRLYRGTQLLGECTLQPGKSAALGPLFVRLAGSEWWTNILLDGSRGMSGIFAGFALLLAGVLSSYCLVPREIMVREAEGGVYVQQIARRFAQFYREEFEELTAAGKTGGV